MALILRGQKLISDWLDLQKFRPLFVTNILIGGLTKYRLWDKIRESRITSRIHLLYTVFTEFNVHLKFVIFIQNINVYL